MRQLVFALTVVFASPVMSENLPETDKSTSLMERGAHLFMEGLLQQMEPALEELESFGPSLRSFVDQMGPALGALLEEIDDWSLYQTPEVLPNGDIIIRRKSPAPPAPEAAPQIDL